MNKTITIGAFIINILIIIISGFLSYFIFKTSVCLEINDKDIDATQITTIKIISVVAAGLSGINLILLSVSLATLPTTKKLTPNV